jgi:hypothetical protein
MRDTTGRTSKEMVAFNAKADEWEARLKRRLAT